MTETTSHKQETMARGIAIAQDVGLVPIPVSLEEMTPVFDLHRLNKEIDSSKSARSNALYWASPRNRAGCPFIPKPSQDKALHVLVERARAFVESSEAEDAAFIARRQQLRQNAKAFLEKYDLTP